MPATKVQLTGGAFQDSEGNKLALGYLEMELSADENIVGVGNIASGITIRIQLDSNGDVVTSPAQSVWGNDQMLPANSYYRVTGYTEAGQPAWGPNNQQVNGDGGTFDVGTWVPNQVISWTPTVQSVELLTNSVDNSDQTKLNIEDTASVTWASTANGVLKATAGGGLTLKTKGVTNSNQALLDLTSSDSSISLSNTSGVTDLKASITSLLTADFLRNLHGILCNPDTTQFSGLGANPASAIGTYANLAPTTTEGPAIQITSQAIPNGQGVVYNNNNIGLAIGPMKYWQTRAKIGSTGASILWYAGLSDVNPGTTLMQTSPTTQTVCAFRWVSGDANWSCVACDGAGTPTIVNSGVPVDTAFHLFQIFPTASGTSVTFKIDGATVATITTHLPGATTNLGTMVTIQANAVTNSIQFIWWSF